MFPPPGDDVQVVHSPVWSDVRGITGTYWILMAMAAVAAATVLLVGGEIDQGSPYAPPPAVFVHTD